MAIEYANGLATAATLRELIQAAAEESCERIRATSKLYRALALTYLDPRRPRSWPPNASACRSIPTATSWPQAIKRIAAQPVAARAARRLRARM